MLFRSGGSAQQQRACDGCSEKRRPTQQVAAVASGYTVEPDPTAEEGEPAELGPAETEAEPEGDGDYEEYVRYGVSVAGIRHAVSLFGDDLKPGRPWFFLI